MSLSAEPPKREQQESAQGKQGFSSAPGQLPSFLFQLIIPERKHTPSRAMGTDTMLWVPKNLLFSLTPTFTEPCSFSCPLCGEHHYHPTVQGGILRASWMHPCPSWFTLSSPGLQILLLIIPEGHSLMFLSPSLFLACLLQACWLDPFNSLQEIFLNPRT